MKAQIVQVIRVTDDRGLVSYFHADGRELQADHPVEGGSAPAPVAPQSDATKALEALANVDPGLAAAFRNGA